MDLKTELLWEHSKAQSIKISTFIDDDPEKFDQLMKLFFDKEYRVTQRAAWVVAHCGKSHPELITPYIEPMIKNLKKEVHVAVIRNTLKLLQEIDIPKQLWGITTDICFKLLESNKPIAVKVFSMTVLANICEKEPDLKNELRIIIEDQLPYGSAGFKSRAAKTLKRL
jgi:HEAT repeat protein